MKKNLAIILALVLAVSLLLPAGAFAAETDSYNVLFRLTGPNAGAVDKTVSSSYKLQSGALKLKEVAANFAGDSTATVESTFAGTGLKAKFDEFKTKATSDNASDWTNAIAQVTIAPAAAQTIIENGDSLLHELETYSPITFTFDAYTVTMTVEKYSAPSGDTGSSTTTPAAEETTKGDDGTEATEKKDAEGNVTEVEVKVPDDVTDTTVPVTADEDTPITIDIPDGKTVTVEIPVEDVKPTTVVKLVKADGTEEILPATAMTEDGLKLVLDDDVTIKIEDVEVTNDIPEDAWYKDAMDYVEAREILEDIPAADVTPLDDCDRGTFTTMLYNLCRQPDASTATGDFEDVKTADFYSDAVAWAKENNIVKGVSETEFDGTSPITREQIVTILWRYAGCPAATAVDTGASDWAADAMSWAVSIGLIKGNGDDTGYRAQDQARVAEAATIIMDFVNGGYAGTSN